MSGRIGPEDGSNSACWTGALQARNYTHAVYELVRSSCNFAMSVKKAVVLALLLTCM